MYLLPQIHSLWSYWCLWIINHDAFDAYESNSDEFVYSHSSISFLTMRPLMHLNHSVWCQWCLSLRQCVAFAAWHSFTSIHLMPLNHSICCRWILWLINLMYLYNTHSLLYEIETSVIYEDMKSNEDEIDFAGYPWSAKYYNPKNNKVLGKFKDETNGDTIFEVVALRSLFILPTLIGSTYPNAPSSSRFESNLASMRSSPSPGCNHFTMQVWFFQVI